MPRDVLSVLARLPATCATWQQGQAWLIRRGVLGMTEFMCATENDVDAFNEKHGVTPEQKRAMLHGCIMGWDSDGAVVQEEGTAHTYYVPFQLLLSVVASHEEDAAKQAHEAADALEEHLKDVLVQFNDPRLLTLLRDGKELDLVEQHSL